MHFLDKRVNVICEELKKLKIRQKFTIDNWQYKEGNYIRPQEAEADTAAWEDFDWDRLHRKLDKPCDRPRLGIHGNRRPLHPTTRNFPCRA